MKRNLLELMSAMMLVAVSTIFAWGQTTTSLNGVVTDQTGAVLVGATVVVRNNATSAEFRTITAGNGTFSIPALDTGTYIVTIQARGFKQAVVKGVKLDAGAPSSVRVEL